MWLVSKPWTFTYVFAVVRSFKSDVQNYMSVVRKLGYRFLLSLYITTNIVMSQTACLRVDRQHREMIGDTEFSGTNWYFA